MAVLRNLKEIPVPDFATADKKSGEVSVYTVEPVTNRRKRYIIGRLLSNGNMNVTSGFKEHHRDLWEKYFGEDTLSTNCPLSCGLYAVLLWLASKTGLYACVQEAFGNKNSNALLDLVSFGIERNSNPDYSLPSYLASHATFSTAPKSEGEYSRLFSSITQDELASFKEMWVKALTQSFEVKKVWLTLDETRFACNDTKSISSCDAKSLDTSTVEGLGSSNAESSNSSSVERMGSSDADCYGSSDTEKLNYSVAEKQDSSGAESLCSSDAENLNCSVAESLDSSTATISDRSAESYCGCSDASQHDCCDDGKSGSDTKNPTNTSQTQHTKTKSPRSRAVVGRITAIATDSNLPVTWFSYKGTAPAASDIKHVADFLAAFGIEVQGIILDRRFNRQDVVNTVESLGYDWVMMLRDDCKAHQHMFEQYAHTIRFNSEYLVGTDDLFAVSGQAPLFNNSKTSSYVSLFFNAMSSAERQVQLVREAYNCVSSINRKIESGLSKLESRVSSIETRASCIESGVSGSESEASGTDSMVSNYESVLSTIEIPLKHQQWVYLDTNEDGSPVAKLKHQALNAASQKIGFFSIASSLDLPCLSAKYIYSMRDAVADGFSIDAGPSHANGLSIDEERSVANRLPADDWFSAAMPHIGIHAGRAYSDASHDAVGTHSPTSADALGAQSAKSDGTVGANSHASADAVGAQSAKSDGAIRAHSDTSADAVGEHSDASYALDESIQSALSCGFITSVLSAMLSMIAKAEDTDVHRLIKGLADIRVLRTSSKDTYSIDNIAKKKYLAIIRNLGITEQCLKDIAAETYIVRDGAYSSYHERVIPNLIEVKDKYGFNKQRGIELSELDNAVYQDMNGLKKRKPGRPKGSKNKSTLEREARMAHTAIIDHEARATIDSSTASTARAANAFTAASTACAATAATTDNIASTARMANEASDALQTAQAHMPQAMSDQLNGSTVSLSTTGSGGYMGAQNTTGSTSYMEALSTTGSTSYMNAHSTSSSMSSMNSMGLGHSIEQDASEAQDMAALDEQPAKPRSKGGRPKGSKNKKTIEREAQLLRDLAKPVRGRPKGSKNKSTLEREALAAQTQVKRGRGRPKGSKNKSTLEREALAAQTQVKRGRGRPKGSKNKSTLEKEAAALQVPKRGPGRPRGSRTKPAPPPNSLLFR